MSVRGKLRATASGYRDRQEISVSALGYCTQAVEGQTRTDKTENRKAQNQNQGSSSTLKEDHKNT